MKRVLAGLAIVPILLLAPAASFAGSSTDAALALGSFAVFNQLVRGETIFSGLFGAPAPAAVVQAPPPVVYAPPPPVVYAPPPPPAYVVVPQPPAVVYAPAPAYGYSTYWVPPGHRGHWRHRHWDRD